MQGLCPNDMQFPCRRGESVCNVVLIALCILLAYLEAVQCGSLGQQWLKSDKKCMRKENSAIMQ